VFTVETCRNINFRTYVLKTFPAAALPAPVPGQRPIPYLYTSRGVWYNQPVEKAVSPRILPVTFRRSDPPIQISRGVEALCREMYWNTWMPRPGVFQTKSPLLTTKRRSPLERFPVRHRGWAPGWPATPAQ